MITDVLDGEAAEISDLAKDIVRFYLDQIALLTRKIDDLTRRLRETTEVNEEMRRLCTVSGVGPVTAGTILAFAPDLRTFSSGRNFAAWLGLVPRQHTTGGKIRLCGISKMGQNDIRRLLNQSRAASIKLYEPIWALFFELHTDQGIDNASKQA